MVSCSYLYPLTDDPILKWVIQFQENRDIEAQNRLVTHYQGLVKILAHKLVRGSDPYEDLVQVGMIGLIVSLKRYNPSFGSPFEGYAIPTIVGEMKRYMRDKTWSVYVPRRIKELVPRVKKAVEELIIQLQRFPRVEEIAQYLNVTLTEVLEAMEMGRNYQPISIDRQIEVGGDGSKLTFLDIVGSQDDGYDQVDHKLLLEGVWAVLTKRESQILRMTFFENQSQTQIGEKLGISQMHVSRLQRRALLKLRQVIHIE